MGGRQPPAGVGVEGCVGLQIDLGEGCRQKRSTQAVDESTGRSAKACQFASDWKTPGDQATVGLMTGLLFTMEARIKAS